MREGRDRSLETLQQDWRLYQARLAETRSQLNSALAKLRQMEQKFQCLDSWLKGMETKAQLRSHRQSDRTTKDAQLQLIKVNCLGLQVQLFCFQTYFSELVTQYWYSSYFVKTYLWPSPELAGRGPSLPRGDGGPQCFGSAGPGWDTHQLQDQHQGYSNHRPLSCFTLAFTGKCMFLFLTWIDMCLMHV